MRPIIRRTIKNHKIYTAKVKFLIAKGKETIEHFSVLICEGMYLEERLNTKRSQ